MKKWISGLLAAAVIFVTMGAQVVTVPAATAVKTENGKFEMMTSAVSLNAGDIVEVTFHMHGGALSEFEGKLKYDDTVLRIREVSPAEYKYRPLTADGVQGAELSDKWDVNDPARENNRLLVRSKNGSVNPKSQDGLVLTIRFNVVRSVANADIGLEGLWVSWNDLRSFEGDVNLKIVNSKAKSFALGTDKVTGNDLISVPVRFTSKDRFSSLDISAAFDTTKLMFDSVTLTDEFKKSATYSVGPTNGSKVTVKFDIAGETSGSKTLCYINFRALNKSGGTGSGSAPAETTTTVDLVAEGVKNQAGDVFLLDEAKAFSQVTITKKTQNPGTGTGRAKLVILGTDPVSGSNTVAVPVELVINEGFSSLGVSVTFDPAKLAFESVTISDAYQKNVELNSYTMAQAGSKLTVNLAAKGDVKTTGTLMYLNFRVMRQSSASTGQAGRPSTGGSSAAKTGTTPVVLTVETVDNLTATELQYAATTTCTVTITEPERLVGDVNGDNRIDLIDVLYIIQAYNNTKQLTDVEKKAADIDKSGTVDLADASILLLIYTSGSAALSQ